VALALLVVAGLSAAPVHGTEPWLIDVTETAGITFQHRTGGTGRKYLPETMGSGGAVIDVDGDGWMDLYFVQSGALPGDPAASAELATMGDELWRSRGDGTFERIPLGEPAQNSERSYGQGAVAGDLDGDGDTDLYRTAFGPNALLLNDGAGTLRAVAGAGGADDPSWSSSAVLFDADGDGDLDLYVVNYLDYTLATHRDCRHVELDLLFYCHPDVYPPAADRFYRNLGAAASAPPRRGWWPPRARASAASAPTSTATAGRTSTSPTTPPPTSSFTTRVAVVSRRSGCFGAAPTTRPARRRRGWASPPATSTATAPST
jgi:hypothetical protein